MRRRSAACLPPFYGISPELVTAGDGSDELISIIMSAFLQKGDKVLTLAPDFFHVPLLYRHRRVPVRDDGEKRGFHH